MNEKNHNNKEYDAFVSMFTEEIKVSKRKNNQTNKISFEDPWIAFAVYVLLPLFSASLALLIVAMINYLF